MEGAVCGGQMHVLCWMTERVDGRGPWQEDFENGLEYAASHGHLGAVQWLFERWHTQWNTNESMADYTDKACCVDGARHRHCCWQRNTDISRWCSGFILERICAAGAIAQ